MREGMRQVEIAALHHGHYAPRSRRAETTRRPTDSTASVNRAADYDSFSASRIESAPPAPRRAGASPRQAPSLGPAAARVQHRHRCWSPISTPQKRNESQIANADCEPADQSRITADEKSTKSNKSHVGTLVAPSSTRAFCAQQLTRTSRTPENKERPRTGLQTLQD